VNELNGYDVEDLSPGMHATFSKTISEADIVLFAGVSGDNNAIHVNQEFARTTQFGGRIAHGFLTGCIISAAEANCLPGPGTVYLSQQLRFRAPRTTRRHGSCHDVTVVSTDQVKSRAVLSTVCRVLDKVVIEGEATVMTTSRVKRAAVQTQGAPLTSVTA